jgi:hypothetical protein
MPEEYADGVDQWDVVSQVFQSLKRNQERTNSQFSRRRSPFAPQVSHIRVNMSDGVQLSTTIINPYPYNATKAAALVRSPYGPTSEHLADLFVLSNGFVAVLQDDRGTFTSGGKFDMWRTARADGRTTMEWIQRQPWSNGDVYTMGISADGINEASQVIGAPPMLKGQWWMWTSGNGHHFAYPGGAYRKDLINGYMNALDIEIHNAGPRVKREIQAHEAYSDFWRNITICRNDSQLEDPTCTWHQVKWPVILSTGWWDIFQETAIDAWNALRHGSDPSVRDRHVHIIAPLGHCILALGDIHPKLKKGENEAIVVAQKIAAETFRGDFNGSTRAQVGRLNLFIMGGKTIGIPTGGKWNYWTSLDAWPRFTSKSYYLSRLGRLSLSDTPVVSTKIEYDYTPSDPAPMVGGNNLPIPLFSKVKHCGFADLSKREKRGDVVTFDSDWLKEDTAVVGHIEARLFVSSSATDTDFFVTVSDLYWGESRLVRYGMVRMRWRDSDRVQSPPLVQGTVYEVKVSLANTAYVFPKGHRVRVSISSAADPYYKPNNNLAEVASNETAEPVTAHNAVHMGPQYPSQIVLPVVDFQDIPENVVFSSLGEQSAEIVVV